MDLGKSHRRRLRFPLLLNSSRLNSAKRSDKLTSKEFTDEMLSENTVRETAAMRHT